MLWGTFYCFLFSVLQSAEILTDKAVGTVCQQTHTLPNNNQSKKERSIQGAEIKDLKDSSLVLIFK